MVTKEQRQGLHKALLSAFSTKGDIQRMSSFKMDEKLDNIAYGPLSDIVTQIIQWCEDSNRIDELITSATSENPGNPTLKEFTNAYWK